MPFRKKEKRKSKLDTLVSIGKQKVKKQTGQGANKGDKKP